MSKAHGDLIVDSTSTRCHDCDLTVSLGRLSQGQKASCPRCAHVITRVHRNALTRVAVFTATALCALVFSNLFTFLRLQAQGQERSLTLPQSIATLFDQGDWVLGVITLTVVIAMPLALSIAIGLLMFDIHSKQASSRTRSLLKLIETCRFWNMAEIYFLGVVVSIIKVISLAEIEFGPSFWFFALFSVVQIAALLHMDNYQLRGTIDSLLRQQGMQAHHRKPDSLQRTTAWLITGILLYIPANLLPIMTVTTLGNPDPNTIVGGVITLWEHGSYPIAAVIFIASVLVPIGKFLVLVWLLLTEHFQLFRRPEAKIAAYRAIEFVGRWSMVDVFVVAFLAGLVQFGNLMAIYPGPAVLFFAGMVIATMLAAASFEPKMFWDDCERH